MVVIQRSHIIIMEATSAPPKLMLKMTESGFGGENHIEYSIISLPRSMGVNRVILMSRIGERHCTTTNRLDGPVHIHCPGFILRIVTFCRLKFPSSTNCRQLFRPPIRRSFCRTPIDLSPWESLALAFECMSEASIIHSPQHAQLPE